MNINRNENLIMKLPVKLRLRSNETFIFRSHVLASQTGFRALGKGFSTGDAHLGIQPFQIRKLRI
jgi:hypothetical protein